MTQVSLIKAVRLGRKQLLDSKCWVDPLGKGTLEVEFKYGVEITPRDKKEGSVFDFYVESKTELVGRAEGKEAVKVSFTFRYGYDINLEGVTVEQIAEREGEFGHMLYPNDRVYLSHQLLEMGVNPSFLPYSVQEDEEEIEEESVLKKGGEVAKRKSGSKKK